MNFKECERKYKGGALSKIIIESFIPVLANLKKTGIKRAINDFIPEINIDKFVVNKIKNQLSKRRSISVGYDFLGHVDVQYRYDGIQIEPTGLLRLLIKKITITNSEILESFNCIISQIEEKYISNNEYIISRVDDIVAHFSDKGVYKPKNAEEKTFYDLAMLILLNYYKESNHIPRWIKPALVNISKGEFLTSWIESLLEYVSEIIAEVSENIFFNFKVTFDSFLVRMVLDKKTNKGQISSLLKMMNVDLKKVIYNFAKKYISPSFIKGFGEIIVNILNYFLSAVSNKDSGFSVISEVDYSSQKPFCITVSAGKDFCSTRDIRWYSGGQPNIVFLEYSYDESFKNSVKVMPECKVVPKTVPTINLGLLGGYKIVNLNRYSVCLENLSSGKIYYKIHSDSFVSEVYDLKIRDIKEDLKFTVFTDSQAMIKQDYEVFKEVANNALKDNSEDFIVHLGDFVDDGNNQEYWNWTLNSKIWKQNVCFAMSGNHEARRSKIALSAGVENSVVSHFNFTNFPPQDTSRGIYYSFEVGNATFIVLNTNFSEDDSCLDAIQYQWASKVLKESESRWKIIFAHKSAYSSGPHRKDSEIKRFRQQISELAYQGNVDLVLSGHDHVYLRTAFMALGEQVGYENKSADNKFINPYGTVFVIPGTSGVKNYKSKLDVSFPIEFAPSVQKPIYTKIKINKNLLTFTAYVYNSKSKRSDILDSFSIEKNTPNKYLIDSKQVSKLIESIPDVPWREVSPNLEKALKSYKSLSYNEKIKVENRDKLFKALRLNKIYLDIINKNIIKVHTKEEFFSALSDSTIGTIIIECDELNFDCRFSGGKKIFIRRPLVIRGCAKLTHVSFIVENKAMLIISDEVCIDNTRKITSLYPGSDVFELHDNTVLVINDNASINSAYAVGKKGIGINVLGKRCAVYLNSSSSNFTSKPFIKSLDMSSMIKVNSGKYFSSPKNSAFVVNGELLIRGGLVDSIKGMEQSEVVLENGIVGEHSGKKIPIETMGRLNLRNGTVRSKDGVSILIYAQQNTKKNNLNLSTIVDIEGEIRYN